MRCHRRFDSRTAPGPRAEPVAAETSVIGIGGRRITGAHNYLILDRIVGCCHTKGRPMSGSACFGVSANPKCDCARGLPRCLGTGSQVRGEKPRAHMEARF